MEKPYFIKTDVEGSETKVLAGLSQTMAYLSFETLLPDFVSELHQCLSIIGSLTPHVTYNIAENEKLLFPSFVSIEKLKEWIAAVKINHFEVVVKME